MFQADSQHRNIKITKTRAWKNIFVMNTKNQYSTNFPANRRTLGNQHPKPGQAALCSFVRKFKTGGLPSVAVNSEKMDFQHPEGFKVNIAQPWTSLLQSLRPFISSKTLDNTAQQAPLSNCTITPQLKLKHSYHLCTIVQSSYPFSCSV